MKVRAPKRNMIAQIMRREEIRQEVNGPVTEETARALEAAAYAAALVFGNMEMPQNHKRQPRAVLAVLAAQALQRIE